MTGENNKFERKIVPYSQRETGIQVLEQVLSLYLEKPGQRRVLILRALRQCVSPRERQAVFLTTFKALCDLSEDKKFSPHKLREAVSKLVGLDDSVNAMGQRNYEAIFNTLKVWLEHEDEDEVAHAEKILSSIPMGKLIRMEVEDILGITSPKFMAYCLRTYANAARGDKFPGEFALITERFESLLAYCLEADMDQVEDDDEGAEFFWAVIADLNKSKDNRFGPGHAVYNLIVSLAKLDSDVAIDFLEKFRPGSSNNLNRDDQSPSPGSSLLR